MVIIRLTWSFHSCSNAVDTFACLIAVDADTLNNANNAITSSAFYETYVFVPVVDGTFIVERPTITMDRQVVNGVCLMHRILWFQLYMRFFLGRTSVGHEYLRRQRLYPPI